LILWGPPGTGKTTIARLLADPRGAWCLSRISAVFSGVADLKKVFDRARQHKKIGRTRHYCLLMRFIASIAHDRTAFCPMSKTGQLFRWGLPRENPSFELNAAFIVARPGAGSGSFSMMQVY